MRAEDHSGSGRSIKTPCLRRLAFVFMGTLMEAALRRSFVYIIPLSRAHKLGINHPLRLM